MLLTFTFWYIQRYSEDIKIHIMILIVSILPSPRPDKSNKISAENQKDMTIYSTCCCVYGNFREAAALITQLIIVLCLEMALYTNPGVKQVEKQKF